MVKASASQSVDLGFIPLVESYQKTLKTGIYSFPAWRSPFWEVVKSKPESSLVLSLGKALKGALLFLKKFVQWFALVLITFKTYKQSPINRILPERARNFLYEYDIHFGLEAFTLRGHNLEKL